MKEPFYWSAVRFRGMSLEDYSKLWRPVAQGKHMIDASTGTVHDLDSPKIIASMQPHVKLIISMREPVSLVWSSFKFYHRENKDMSPSHFHRHAKARARQMKRCTRRKEIEHQLQCINAFEPPRRRKGVRLHIGMFVLYLEHWWKHFPKQNIMRIYQQELTSEGLLPRVREFLGLEVLQYAIPTTSHSRPPTYQGHEVMLNETAQLLASFFYPWNQRLYQATLDEVAAMWVRNYHAGATP